MCASIKGGCMCNTYVCMCTCVQCMNVLIVHANLHICMRKHVYPHACVYANCTCLYLIITLRIAQRDGRGGGPEIFRSIILRGEAVYFGPSPKRLLSAGAVFVRQDAGTRGSVSPQCVAPSYGSHVDSRQLPTCTASRSPLQRLSRHAFRHIPGFVTRLRETICQRFV